jgi:hypothetical protein
VCNGTRWVAVGQFSEIVYGGATVTGPQLLTSTDGKAWSSISTTTWGLEQGSAKGVAWNGIVWIVVTDKTILKLSTTNINNIPSSSPNVIGEAVAYGKYQPYNSKNGVDWTGGVTLPNIDRDTRLVIKKDETNKYLLINREETDFSNLYIDASAIEIPVLPNVDNSLNINSLGFELVKDPNTNINYTVYINGQTKTDWSYCTVEYSA